MNYRITKKILSSCGSGKHTQKQIKDAWVRYAREVKPRHTFIKFGGPALYKRRGGLDVAEKLRYQ